MTFRLSACHGVLPSRAQLPCCSPQVFKLSRPTRITQRSLATSSTRPDSPPSSDAISSNAEAGENAARQEELTGSAKLMAEALVEEETMKAKEHWRELREKEAESAPVWTGEESQKDAVLRMLVDSPANRPLRSDLVQSAEEKIKQALKKVDLSPRTIPTSTESTSTTSGLFGSQPGTPEESARQFRPLSEAILAERDIPPEDFKPWMARYVARDSPGVSPSVLYGKFLPSSAKQSSTRQTSHMSLLDKPAGFNPNDPKHRKAWKEMKQTEKLVGRVEGAREGALDYRVGGKQGTESHGRVQGLSSLRAWEGLVEERIQQAQQAGWFKNVPGRGKPMKEDPDLLHMDRTEFHLNRIMKRQGAKPPWIELQNELDAAHASFRSTLLESYSRAVVRSLVTSPYHDNASLSALTVEDISKLRDSRWQAREQAYHAEHIKSLNNIVRRMNAQAPQVARRGLVVLQNELDLLYQDAAPIIHAELVKRRNADWDKKKAGGDFRYGSEDNSGNGNGAFSGAWQLTTGKVGLVFVAMGGLTYIVQQTVSTNGKGSNSSQGSRGDQYGNRGNHGGSSVVASSPAEEEVGFSSIRIIKVYILEPISTFFRFLRLAMLFGPVILTAPMLLVGTPAASKRRRAGVVVDEGERWGAVWWFGFLVRQMEKAGPTFIKLGQWAASRADLFPASLCELMGKLHSNGHPHALSYTKQVLEEAFQESFDDIFDEFEEEPIGCGAIAQVYRAKLNSKLLPESFMAKRTKQSTKDGVPIEEVVNTSVAVKVVHPRVEQNIRRDLAIMSLFANVLNLFPGMEWLSLPEEVDVFGDMMNMQLDLRVEANNLERFINNFEHRGPGISFPRPIRTKGEHTGDAARKVLVEEYEDALPLKYFLVNGGGQYDAAIANSGLDAFLNMLLLDNWTHGDLHPGNIMIRFYKATTKDFFQHLASQFFSTPEPADPILSTETASIVKRLRAVHNDPEQWVAELDRLAAEGYEPELIFIDAGLVTTLDPTNRRNFLDLFQAIAEFDGYKAGHLMVERCRNPELVIDAETFALKIQHLVLRVKSTTFSLAAIKISDILTDVLKNVRDHHVKLEGDFVNTVISILLLEGIGRRLKDDLDLLKSALPILRQLGRQMGTKEAIAQVPKGNIWAMAKIWVYLEAREIAGSSTVTNIDDWVKFSGFD